MTLPLLYIRIKQFQKELNGLGVYLLLLIPLTGFFIFFCFTVFKRGQSAYLLVTALACFCTLLQYYRKDKSFVYKHTESPHLQIFSEYVALTFPFSVSCLITKSWFWYPILLAFLLCLPFFQFKIKQKVIFKNLSSIISPSRFEWLSGLRKHFLSVLGLYILAIAFCWFIMLPLFLLWFLTVLITSFYTECESIQILREGAKSPRNFLLSKFKVCTIYIIVLYTPILTINTICNIEFLLVNLLFIPTQISILYFGICLKYTSYSPNKGRQGNNIPLAIVSMGSALPYLLPIPTILSFVYFYKAENNLKKYLND